MDVAKLQAILRAQGIRIGDDDPLFTMIALNEAILKDMANDVGALINTASAPTRVALKRLEDRLGDVPHFAAKEMQAAATSQQEAMTQEMVGITRQLVGDAITARRADSLFLAGIIVGGVAVSMFVAGLIVSGQVGAGTLGIASVGTILGGLIGVAGTKYVMDKTETERMTNRRTDVYLKSPAGQDWLEEQKRFKETIKAAFKN